MKLSKEPIVWEGLEEGSLSMAVLYDDRPVGFWERVKVAIRYVRTGKFEPPDRLLAYWDLNMPTADTLTIDPEITLHD